MLQRLVRTGLRKGLVDGNRRWLVIGATAGALRILGRMARKEPTVVFCEELHPGETLVIKHDTAEPEVLRT